MAKSSKKRKQQASDQRQTKKQIALGRKQARQNRIIYVAVAVLAVMILVVIAAGLIVELVVNPARPVGKVNNTTIRTDDFESLLQYRRYGAHNSILNLQEQLGTLDPDDQTSEFMRSIYEQQLGQLQTSVALAPDQTLDELIDDMLIQEKAADSGITVTENEITEAINDDLQLAAAPRSQATGSESEQAPTPTPVPQEELDAIYENALAGMGLTDEDLRSIVERGLYRTKLQEFLASQVITTGLVVHTQLIQTDTQQDNTAALERIEAGEDFAIVAREVSTDTLTAEEGGDLGWITTGQLTSRYGEEVETAVFALPVGQVDEVQSNGKFYVISVLARDEDGPLPAEVVSQRQSSAFSDWLAERKEAADLTIERLLDPEAIPPDPFASLSGSASPY